HPGGRQVDAAEHPDRALVVDHKHGARRRARRQGGSVPLRPRSRLAAAAEDAPANPPAEPMCRSGASWLADLGPHLRDRVYVPKIGGDRGRTRIGTVSETPKIGILAVQGNVREHAAALRGAGVEPVEVRTPEEIADLADLEIAGEDRPLRGVFIRAPRVIDVGPEVEVLAELNGEPVLLRQGRMIVASFHPELTGDTRIHERFLELVREELHVRT